jgi:hypothetical protein
VAGAVAGNPFNPIWGVWVRRVYDTLGMDTFNDPLWLGVVPLVLVLTRRDWMAASAARRWLLLTLAFSSGALGPFLTAFGVNTGLPLPQILLRYVPVVSNARIPAHAAVMVCLGVAVLLAFAIATSRRLRSPAAAACVLVVVLIDLLVRAVPAHSARAPAALRSSRRAPARRRPGRADRHTRRVRTGRRVRRERAVFPDHSRTPDRNWLHRTPAAGECASATTPPRTMLTLFRLSSGDEPAAAISSIRPRRGRSCRETGTFATLIVHERQPPRRVRRFVEGMGLRVIDRDASRTLYAIE